MSTLRLHAVAFSALVSVTACVDDELDDTGTSTGAIQVDPACLITSLRLFPQPNYQGVPLCLSGIGTYTLPARFDTGSWIAGASYGSFVSVLGFNAWTQAASTTPETATAPQVYRGYPPDAGL